MISVPTIFNSFKYEVLAFVFVVNVVRFAEPLTSSFDTLDEAIFNDVSAEFFAVNVKSVLPVGKVKFVILVLLMSRLLKLLELGTVNVVNFVFFDKSTIAPASAPFPGIVKVVRLRKYSIPL